MIGCAGSELGVVEYLLENPVYSYKDRINEQDNVSIRYIITII